jgi:hypothetical protein
VSRSQALQIFIRGIAEPSLSSASKPQKRLPTARWSAVEQVQAPIAESEAMIRSRSH